MATKQLLINTFFILTFFFIGCSNSNRATQPENIAPDVIYTPGEIISDGQGFVSYRVGNTPIIITVPHDGVLSPAEFADRTGDTTRSINTRKLAEQFAYAFYMKSNGLYPHIIYNNLSRLKLDPSLNQANGAQGNSYANLSYRTYHNFVQTAIDTVDAHFDSGILINLIEHNHSNQRIELGYLISSEKLNLTNNELNGIANESSIQQLASIASINFSELIRGPSSLGNNIIARSFTSNDVTYQFDAIPTVDSPNPGQSSYNSGGYMISSYGSHNGGKINAIELSTPYSGFRDNANAYRALANILEESITSFYESNLGIAIY